MNLYFVRHGESTANVLGVFSNEDHKHPLTEKGVEQARALAHSLSGLSFDGIYSSPILRARQTAEILAEALQVPLQIADALREWDVGIYEGSADPVGWEAHARVQDLWFNHRQLDSRMPGGESFNHIRSRFFPFVEGLLFNGRNSDRRLILVGHGGLYTAMLPALLTNVDHAFALQHPFPNAGCVVAETRPEGLSCLSWCGISMDGHGG
jgi:broad specificity phosphatase PhoE